MRIPRAILLFVSLAMLSGLGCGTKTSADASGDSSATAADSAAGDASQVNTGSAKPAVGAIPKTPVEPSAAQLAKWAVADYQPLELLACADGFGDPAVLSMAVSPDGKQFALGGAKLTLWYTKDSEPTGELLSQYKSDEVERPLRAVAISPDGVSLAAGDQKGTVRVWNLSDQREVVAIKAHNGHVTQLAFSPDSHLLATTSYSGEVTLWQLPGGKKLKSLKMDKQEITNLVFLSDNLLAAGGSAATIWNIETGKKEADLTTKYVRGPALGLSRDGRLLAFSDAEGGVQLWDVAAGKATGVTLQGAGAHRIDFSPDGKWIATHSQDSTIRIWNATTGSLVQVIDADGDPTTALRWLPDCNALLMASASGRVRIWGAPSVAETIGIKPLELPTVAATPANHRSLSSAQLQRVIDVRSFPRLPGAVPQWSDYGMCSYTVAATQADAEMFYRYYMGKAGWTEAARTTAGQPGLLFRKADCELNVSFAPAAESGGRAGDLQVSLHFPGNYDVRWLPKIGAINSKSSWDSFSSTTYRTKAELTDVEVALLKKFHDAGWTAYTRLAASGSEDPKSRSISMLQGGSVLTVSIGYPADSTDELYVQTSVSVANKSLPIPPDAGWIEFDASTELQTVINTKMDLQQTTDFYDKQMAAEGWLARTAGRTFKDDKAWLPYIRGQQDIFLRLTALPSGGTQIVVGDAARSSWQLKKPADASEKSVKPGIEAADFALPKGAAGVKFDVDEKQIEFAVPGTTPTKLGEQFAAQMEALEWQRDGAGLISDEYVLLTYKKDKAEIQLRARSADKQATAMISGDGLLWAKPLPTAPVRISYETWLRRQRKDATLAHLDAFTAEMHKISTGSKSK